MTSGRVVLAQLSDLHLREGEDESGREARLEAAVRAVAELRPKPDAVLLSGDLVDEPSPAAYAGVQRLLEPLAVPVHAIPGNHDDRDMLRARFGPHEQEAAPGAPVRFAVSCGELRLVGCDSTMPGSDSGALGGEQLEWLERTLASEPEAPTLLALHHPPVMSGLSGMDEIALDGTDSVALAKLLERHPQVQTVTCGHVHTAMATTFAGRCLLICPSTNSTVRLDLEPDAELEFSTTQRPLGLAVHALVGGRVVSHLRFLRA